jgi:hypothetical protein
MEWWNVGQNKDQASVGLGPLFHHSNIPTSNSRRAALFPL